MSMTADAAPTAAATVYRPSAPLSLGRTLGRLGQFGSDPSARHEAGSWWFGLRTPHGPATLRLRSSAGGAVHADAWGDGAEWAIAGVPALLGADDDLEGFDAARHPLIAELHRRAVGLRMARTGLVMSALLPAILFQKVTGREASEAWRTLLRFHGDAAPGPAPRGLRVAPTIEGWRRIPSWDWHRAGVTPQRRDTIQRALAVATGLERAAAVDAVEARRRLRSVAGVGVWTAAETVQRSHGDPDAVSVGDFHTCKAVGTALIGERVDDAGMLELLEPWRGHRQRVVRLIESSGIGYERHGPRMTIPEHRNR